MEKRTIPDSLVVGGHDYTIKYEPRLLLKENRYGVTEWHEQTVSLEPVLSMDSLNQTFWHEVIHLIDRHYTNCSLSEDATDNLAEGLYQVMKQLGLVFSK